MQLKDILGKPGEGIHFHVCGIAIVDVLLTILAGYGIGRLAWSYQTRDASLWPFVLVPTIMLFILGEGLHLLIGVDTTVAKFLKGMFS